MKRRDMLLSIAGAFAGSGPARSLAAPAEERVPQGTGSPGRSSKRNDRPNILWVVSEDNGPFFGCYGDPFANTPNLDQLARDGILYENAFANAPVCAPARFTIITGMYAPSLGTQHMRSRNRIPPQIRLFPWYLRQAGYFCSNRSKTDYNLTPVPDDAWNQIRNGHWRKRQPGQPFFSVFNIGTSHESSLHRSKVEPAYLKEKFTLPPYHPDTPEIRSNWVEYYHIITRMDQQVGQILAELEKDGLAENTIVFYYADHGGILPRSKRYLNDTGVHVPMIVRFPKKFRHLAPGKPGTRTDRLVSFVDLAPTILSLAGVEIPEAMQGEAFLGPQQAPPRDYVYLFRGRMDERYDMMRAVRDKRYKYIRNYLPHRVYGQHLNYLWKMPATRSWEKAYKEGRVNDTQKIFWEPKPTEELYDVKKDPWEVNNLAGDPKYKAVLTRMREANRSHILRIRDAGFLPESEMIDRAEGSTIFQLVRDPDKYPLERIMPVAEMAGERDPKALPKLIRLLEDKDAAVRYWAATGCVVLGTKADAAADALVARLEDPVPSVRIAAAEALCVLDKADKALPVLVKALEHENPRVVLHAINTLENVGEKARPVSDSIQTLAKTSKDNYVKNAAAAAAAKLNL